MSLLYLKYFVVFVSQMSWTRKEKCQALAGARPTAKRHYTLSLEKQSLIKNKREMQHNVVKYTP